MANKDLRFQEADETVSRTWPGVIGFKMKFWALIVAGLYIVLLAMLTVPATALAFGKDLGFAVGVRLYSSWGYWAWLGVMALSQLALLAVPVQVARFRPVKRGPVWWTLLAGGLMTGGLAVAAYFSIYEFATRLEGDGSWSGWIALLLGVLTWCGWAVIFGRMSRNVQPSDLVSRQCRWLFRGSVLELLIAVPTHIAARSRNDCCAGCLTFMGLTMGISVMLFSFGPAVFFLYAERWKRLHPPPTGTVTAGA
jgi:hypothetical protein